MDLVDNNGEWPTAIHDAIIDIAFPGLSAHQVSVLKSTSAYMDRLANQSEARSYQHAMRAPDELPSKAKEDTRNFVKTQEHTAQEEQGGEPKDPAAIKDNSLRSFGEAAHVVADSTSPAHVDSHGNPLPWNPKSLTGVLDHRAAESTITRKR